MQKKKQKKLNVLTLVSKYVYGLYTHLTSLFTYNIIHMSDDNELEETNIKVFLFIVNSLRNYKFLGHFLSLLFLTSHYLRRIFLGKINGFFVCGYLYKN